MKIKAYIERDMAALYPLLQEYGFKISEFCVQGTFYDTWSHPESNLVIHASYDIVKKKRRWLPWRGSWGNFSVSVKLNFNTMVVHTSEKLSHDLTKEFVAYLGGRMEVRTQISNTDSNQSSIDVYEYTPPETKNTQKISSLIESLIVPKGEVHA